MVNRRAIPCLCQIERRIRRELPPRFHAARVADFGPELQVAVRHWVGERGDGLLITGPAGTGKTHLAAAIVRTVMEQGQRAVFRRSAEFYAALREAYGGGVTERVVMEPLLREPLLAFDDLGAGSLSDHERRSTLEVLDRRVNALLPTVVTTNWLLRQIAERIDDRVASRLAAFVNLELDGADRRLGAGQNPRSDALK